MSVVSDAQSREEVRQFYDRIGWQMEGNFYQNARYEDLRQVSAEYIHQCHLRVGRHLKPQGVYFLDAGSGPIQYPEYLTYSQGFRYRVCVDISFVALSEARRRVGAHGLFVVADVANLPFKDGVFEALVSLHTFHHLPAHEQKQAYQEAYRVLAAGCSAVVVNGWTDSVLMRYALPLVRVMERLNAFFGHRAHQGAPSAGAGVEVNSGGVETNDSALQDLAGEAVKQQVPQALQKLPTGTFVNKMGAEELRSALQGEITFQIYCWRSVSVRFLRAVIHPKLAGRLWLRLLYMLEERFPHFFGEKGQYPLIVFSKSE
ncbi:MAG: class I SAM-dependent methyltransferase [Anaerolineae bacterium]|nr:class I SAM-dependent methyltransferase [Anaerolineae bacterium]